MREYEYALKDNGQYLELFRNELAMGGAKDRAIKGHLDNVMVYINTYLPPKTMEEGCGYEIHNFLGDACIRSGATGNMIKKCAASIKKFYKCMADNDVVTESAFEELSTCIKKNMDIWQQRVEAYLDEDEEWMNICLQEESEEIVPVLIEDLVEAFFDENPYWKQYYNLFTGEIVMVPSYIEEDDYSDVQVKLSQQVDLSESYVQIPGKEDIDTYSIMLDYIDQQEDENYQKELLEAIHGSRALHDFKKIVQDYCEWGNYNAYLVDNVTYMMVTWCVESQLPCDSKIEEIQELIHEVQNGQ